MDRDRQPHPVVVEGQVQRQSSTPAAPAAKSSPGRRHRKLSSSSRSSIPSPAAMPQHPYSSPVPILNRSSTAPQAYRHDDDVSRSDSRRSDSRCDYSPRSYQYRSSAPVSRRSSATSLTESDDDADSDDTGSSDDERVRRGHAAPAKDHLSERHKPRRRPRRQPQPLPIYEDIPEEEDGEQSPLSSPARRQRRHLPARSHPRAPRSEDESQPSPSSKRSSNGPHDHYTIDRPSTLSSNHRPTNGGSSRSKTASPKKKAKHPTQNPLYCPSTRCREQIKPENMYNRNNGREYGKCSKCRTEVCTDCGSKWHDDVDRHDQMHADFSRSESVTSSRRAPSSRRRQQSPSPHYEEPRESRNRNRGNRRRRERDHSISLSHDSEDDVVAIEEIHQQQSQHLTRRIREPTPHSDSEPEASDVEDIEFRPARSTTLATSAYGMLPSAAALPPPRSHSDYGQQSQVQALTRRGGRSHVKSHSQPTPPPAVPMAPPEDDFSDEQDSQAPPAVPMPPLHPNLAAPKHSRDSRQRHSEHRHSEPRHSEPRHSEPRHSEPRRPEHHRSEHRHSDPRHSEPRHSEPRHSENRHGQSRGHAYAHSYPPPYQAPAPPPAPFSPQFPPSAPPAPDDYWPEEEYRHQSRRQSPTRSHMRSHPQSLGHAPHATLPHASIPPPFSPRRSESPGLLTGPTQPPMLAPSPPPEDPEYETPSRSREYGSNVSVPRRKSSQERRMADRFNPETRTNYAFRAPVSTQYPMATHSPIHPSAIPPPQAAAMHHPPPQAAAMHHPPPQAAAMHHPPPPSVIHHTPMSSMSPMSPVPPPCPPPCQHMAHAPLHAHHGPVYPYGSPMPPMVMPMHQAMPMAPMGPMHVGHLPPPPPFPASVPRMARRHTMDDDMYNSNNSRSGRSSDLGPSGRRNGRFERQADADDEEFGARGGDSRSPSSSSRLRHRHSREASTPTSGSRRQAMEAPYIEEDQPSQSSMAGLGGSGRGMSRVEEWTKHVGRGIPTAPVPPPASVMGS